MKKALLLFVAVLATSSVFAEEWQKPTYTGSFLPITVDDTVYIYNTEAQLFLTEGNDYGTHATVGETGLPFIIRKYVADGADWDGMTYTISDSTITKGYWTNLFITDGAHLYTDRREQADYFFSFKDLDNNTYQIYGASLNPVWNTSDDKKDYVIGRDIYYQATINNTPVVTGTGVIYADNGEESVYAPGEFQTTWAFVSKTNYAGYLAEIERYETAMQLKELIDQATEYELNVTDEQGVYANTSSSKQAMVDAMTSINLKLKNYYETVITPETPMLIAEDDCNNINAWTNGIGASTWNTQSWIDGSWTGFEGTTLNIWGASLVGKASMQKTNLPNGIYVVSMAAYSQKMDGYVYANLNKKAVGKGAAGNTYVVTTNVTDGTLEFGFGQDKAGENWVAIDNLSVKYYGAGYDAYKFWLDGLKENSDFSDAKMQESLITEYEALMQEVEDADTKEKILAVIAKCEEAFNQIALNIAAYETLYEAIEAATTLKGDEALNTYYVNLLEEAIQAKGAIYSDAEASTEAVQATTAELQSAIDEAQDFIWQMPKLTEELETAQGIYDEFGEECAPAAAEAYTTFVANYTKLDQTQLTVAQVNALLEELWVIEFNLGIPDVPASDENPVDYTARIQYASFDSGSTGWVVEGWSTAANNTDWNPTDGHLMDALYLNLWNPKGSTGRIYQTITDLPAGTYVVQFSAYAKQAGMQVYANEDYMDIVLGTDGNNKTNTDGVAHIYGATTEDFTITDEDGAVTTPTVWYGNAYQITTTVGEDGTLEIGIRGNNPDDELWGMADNAKLTYYGTESTKIPTDISGVSNTQKRIKTIYTATGAQVPALQKGVNIVKYSDGSAKKIVKP